MLTDEQITKFQNLYKNRFGIEINQEAALEQGIRLIQLISIMSENYKNPSNNENDYAPGIKRLL